MVAGFGGLDCPVIELGGGQALVGSLVEIACALVPFVHPLAGAVKFLDDLVAAGVVLVLEAGAQVLAGLLIADDAVAVERLPFRLRYEKSAATPAKLHGGLALDEVQKEEAVVRCGRAEVVAVDETPVFVQQHGLNKLRLTERLVFFLEVQRDAVVQVAEKLDGEILKENDFLQRRDHRTCRLKQMLQRPIVDWDGVVKDGSRQRPLKWVVALEGVHKVRKRLHHVLKCVVVEDLALVEVGDDVVGHGSDVVDDLHIRAEVQLRELDDLLLNR